MEMHPKLILAVAGGLGTGKGTAAQHLISTYDATVLEFSGPLRDVLKRLHLPIDRKHMVNLSVSMREVFGNDLLAKIIAKDAHNARSTLLVLDGARRPEDLLYIKDDPRFRLAYLTADTTKRYERLVLRNQNSDDRNKTYTDFLQDLNDEPEQMISALLPIANVTWTNDTTPKGLFTQINSFLLGEGIEPK